MNRAAPFDDDQDFPTEEERRIQHRRLFIYSTKAIEIGLQAERIFVRHPAFAAGLKAIDRCFQLARTFDMPNGVILTGPTGTGKTSVMRHFRQSLPVTSTLDSWIGVMAIRLQFRPTAGQIVSSLLRQMRYPFAHVTNKSVYIKRDIAFEAIAQKKCRLLLVDEGQFLANQVHQRTRAAQDSAATELLRELMDATGVNLVIAADAAPDFLDEVDPALASRVSVRLALSNFSHTPPWYGFVKTHVEQCSAIDLAYLTTPEGGERLHGATGGNPRAFKRIAVEAVLIAVDADKSAVDREIMALAYERVNGKDGGRANPYVPGD